MKLDSKKIELLAPAGDLAKLKTAFRFGADAVYCGLPALSLRARVNKFTQEDLTVGIKYAHQLGKKVFVALNIYAHNCHLGEVKKHILFLKKIKPDALIISDPGIIMLVRKYWPQAEIHLSTQANTTNFLAANFWQKAGVKRIILARELTLKEIKEIGQKTKDLELECFVHGAMCMSYSGRCILSKWIMNRSANLGDCAQPCRWAYHVQKIKDSKLLRVIDDQQRFNLDLEEDQHGTYFFNSYDLNLIEQIPELIKVGVGFFKIEGRAKSAYYLAIVTRAYRQIINAVKAKATEQELKKIIEQEKRELNNLVHRGYTTGFLLGNEPEHNFLNRNNETKFQFVGEVENQEKDFATVYVHNGFSLKDRLEAITPQKNISLKIKKILDYKGKKVATANGGHQHRYQVFFDTILQAGDLLRREANFK